MNLPVNISEMFDGDLLLSVSLLHVGLQEVLVVLDGVVSDITKNDYTDIHKAKKNLKNRIFQSFNREKGDEFGSSVCEVKARLLKNPNF